jgi:hypothetical protein
MEGVRKVADGAWLSGGIDTEAGYFAEVGDTEHTGEWTGDTLVAMIRTDYGNPVYIERALRTGKLMRDLWMDRNTLGSGQAARKSLSHRQDTKTQRNAKARHLQWRKYGHYRSNSKVLCSLGIDFACFRDDQRRRPGAVVAF